MEQAVDDSVLEHATYGSMHEAREVEAIALRRLGAISQRAIKTMNVEDFMATFCESANDVVLVRNALSTFATQRGVDERIDMAATDMVAEFCSLCESGWSLWSHPDPIPAIASTPMGQLYQC